MRDILPADRGQGPVERDRKQPQTPPPPALSTPPARPRLSGPASALPASRVPVSKIHVPPERDVAWSGPSVPAGPSHDDHDHPNKTDSRAELFYQKKQPIHNQFSPKRFKIGHRERTIVFGLLALGVFTLGLASFIFLPKATIALTLKTAPLLVDKQLIIRAEDVNQDNVVPGTAFFREIEVTGEAGVKTMEVVGHKAAGLVQLVNRSSDEQKIKEHSRLVTKEGVLFFMKKHAIIPPNGSVTVEIEAAEAGESGNLQPQRLTFAALAAGSERLLYGEVTKPLTGGSGESVAVVGESDIEAAKQEAQAKARTQAEADIRQELPAGWLVIEESWTPEIQSFEATAKVGDRADKIPYKARVALRVMGYEPVKLEEYLRDALNTQLGSDYMLFPGDISYTKSITSIDWQKAEAVIQTQVTHTTIPRFSLETLRDKLAGQSEKDAQRYLEGLPGVQSVKVELWPFWVRGIPRIQSRVTIDLVPDRQP